MRVLVTGGSGFLGRNLVHRLVEMGLDVTVLHRRTSTLAGLPEGISLLEGDIIQPETIQGACEGMDWVFHVAGEVAWGKWHRQRMYRINVDGARNIATEALKSGVKRFIHTSSAAAVGLPERDEIDESFAFNGRELQVEYAIAKRAGEDAVLALVEQGLPAVVVNPTVIIGIRAEPGGFVHAVLQGKLSVAPSGGVNVCNVTDVVCGHLLAAEKGRIGERYILGGTNLPLLSFLQQLADQGQTGLTIRQAPRNLMKAVAMLGELASVATGKDPAFAWDLAKLTGRNIYYSSSKAERELGYTITPLTETIEEIVAWEKQKML
ncbi:NAD-dependent epimerase/dehydratase family protein [Laceyella putida]|uniref:NAD-dependent epimerase/dehydratase family protein n=1 Tax=Laceyella putida TaxID=110101 RepID=A0ABW2RIX6_9BACL